MMTEFLVSGATGPPVLSPLSKIKINRGPDVGLLETRG